MKIPCVKKPCKDCPFRKDTLKGWLGKNRMVEILGSESFVCHKNTNLQCAGHMILKKEDNGFVKLAKRLNDNLELKGQTLVFADQQSCIDHHTNG